MTGSEPTPSKVFISYSHDSSDHVQQVLALADRLRSEGVDCTIDQYNNAPAEGWNLWMTRQIERADFVLMVCTPTYRRRVMGEEETPGKGLGARWEGHLTLQDLYEGRAINRKFIPILLGSDTEESIPKPLRAFTHYRPSTEEGYERLYRRLTEQPEIVMPEIGRQRRLPPRTSPFKANVASGGLESVQQSSGSVPSASTLHISGSGTVSSRVWFSQYFGLDKPQYELPFVDFDLDSDVPLYIDPYAISKDPTDLAAHCHNAIRSYFQSLLAAVRSGNGSLVQQLIHDRLVEPKEIHLGVGEKARSGAGLGPVQEEQVVGALVRSEAAKAGLIEAIQELELHIPGVGPDKISDLVANIIKGHLARYTETICEQLGIETRPIAVSGYWNNVNLEWDGGFFNLPSRGVDAYILVPKRFIRRDKDLVNHRYFY